MATAATDAGAESPRHPRPGRRDRTALPWLRVRRKTHAGRTWKHRKADGSAIDVAIFFSQLTYEGQRAALIAAVDITERKRAEAHVAYMAHHDALTALPNRILLRLRMEEMIAGMRRSGPGFAVLCIDLDNFKWVNDTLGHPLGDRAAAERRGAAARRASRAGHHCPARRRRVRHPPDRRRQARGGERSAGAAAGCIRRAVRSRRPHRDGRRQHRRGACARRRRRSRPAAEERRHGALPRQGRRQGRVPLLRAGDGCARAGAAAAGNGPARGAPGRELRGALPAAGQSRHRRDPRARGADPLAASRARDDPAVGVHSGRRRDRPDRADRAVRAAARLRRRGAWPDDVKVAVNLSPLQFKSGSLLQAVRDALGDVGPCRRRGSSSRSPRPCCSTRASMCSRRCMRCARSASASRWTTSAPATRR